MSGEKQVRSAQKTPSGKELIAEGIRELTFEELLAVNGGRHVIDDPNTDNVSDTIANGGHSATGSSAYSGSSGSSSGSSGGTYSGESDSSAPMPSTPSEPADGNISGDTAGNYSAEYTGYWEGAYTGGYENGSSSDDNSGSSDNDSSSSDYSDSGSDSGSESSDSDGICTESGSAYTLPEQNQEPAAANSPPARKPESGTAHTSQNQKSTIEQNARRPERLKDRFYAAKDGGRAFHDIFKNMKDNAVGTLDRWIKKEKPKAIGVDDDQYKIQTQLDRQKGVIVSFDKSEEKLKVNSYRKLENGDWQLTRVYTMDARNNVRNELNKRREAPDITTCPRDGSEAQWYFPRQFPNGTWELGLSRKSESSNVEGVFIPTTAYQDVPVYGPKSSSKPVPDANGNYIATGVQSDTGYGIHFAPGTTWGCIGLNTIADAVWLAKITDSALLSTNGFARLRVQE